MKTPPSVGPAALTAQLCGLTAALTFALIVICRVLEHRVGGSAAISSTSVGIFLVLMVIPIARVRRFHPLPTLGPANWVTTTRAALVALVAGLAASRPAPMVATAAVVIASIAAILDGWDGWLARRTRMESAFGSRFDMEVDALLILLLGVFAWRYEKAGAWVLLSGSLRYLFLIGGWIWPWLQRALPHSLRRKTVCVIQIVGLIVAIAPIIAWPLSAAAAGVTLILLVWSFAVDVLWLWQHRPAPG